MSRRKVIFLLLLIIPIFSLFSFDAEHLNKITFVNKTGLDIWYIFLSPADSDEWGFDILGSERLIENNSLLGFYISYPDEENLFDIMAIDEDGNTFIIFEQPINDNSEEIIVITEADLDDENPEMEFLTVNFYNEASPMYYIFVSPQDSEMWGVDMMDDEQTLDSYDTLSLLVPVGEDEVPYDVLCVDEDDDEYKFTLYVNTDYADEYDEIDISIEYSDMVVDE